MVSYLLEHSSGVQIEHKIVGALPGRLSTSVSLLDEKSRHVGTHVFETTAVQRVDDLFAFLLEKFELINFDRSRMLPSSPS